jgi:hypothetical protein
VAQFQAQRDHGAQVVVIVDYSHPERSTAHAHAFLVYEKRL